MRDPRPGTANPVYHLGSSRSRHCGASREAFRPPASRSLATAAEMVIGECRLPSGQNRHQVGDFIDGGEDRDDLERLRNSLAPGTAGPGAKALPEPNVYRYDGEWKTDRPETNLNMLCDRVYADLKQVIDDELADFTQRPALEREREAHAAFGAERCAHFKGRKDALRCVSDYLNGDSNKPLVIHGTSGSGKTALMAQAAHLLASDANSASSKTPGFPGSAAFSEGRRRPSASEKPGLLGGPETGPKTTVRFIGATPGSADLRSLLRSLCEELGVADIPQDMNELVRTFRERLSGQSEAGGSDDNNTSVEPATLFLDALDQLNDTDNAWMLYWLPRELAPSVKLVISVLEPDSDAQESDTSESDAASPPFNADPCDLAKRIWPDALMPLSEMSRQEGADLLDAWLGHAGRALQPEQRDDVLNKFEADGRPLYLKLAFEEARLWHSWDGLSRGADDVPGLGESVAAVLDDLFCRLERPEAHGRIFVERALGSLASAKNGLTEDEMLDVLSRDVDVYSAFVRAMHHIPGDLAASIADALAAETGQRAEDISHADVQARFDQWRDDADALRAFLENLVEKADAEADARIKDPAGDHPESTRTPRLPVVPWSRLHAALKPYLTERRADGTNVMSFYHRQVGEAIRRRYLHNSDSAYAAHQRLAQYFRGFDYWAESLEAQRARAKRLPPTPRPANIRKVVELPYHLLEAAKLNDPESNKPEAKEWDAVADLLTDWQFLEAKTEADPSGKYGPSIPGERQ